MRYALGLGHADDDVAAHRVGERCHVGEKLDVIGLAVAVCLPLVIDVERLGRSGGDQALQIPFGNVVEGDIEKRHATSCVIYWPRAF